MYNYNYNGNYNPYAPYQAQMGQTQQMPRTSGNQDERIWVQGRGAAEAYLVAPGGFARLWDSDGRTFYEKTADASGRPMMETFTYTRETPKTMPNPEDYARSEELLSKRLEAVEKRIRALEEVQNHDAEEHQSNADDAAVYAV